VPWDNRYFQDKWSPELIAKEFGIGYKKIYRLVYSDKAAGENLGKHYVVKRSVGSGSLVVKLLVEGR
jgi:ribosomal protein S24E